jgi:hypothetical protein
MAGKCSNCDAMLNSVRLEHISVQGNKSWHGVAYLCPFCSALLSVQIDPVAIQSDTVSSIRQEIERLVQVILQELRQLGAALLRRH